MSICTNLVRVKMCWLRNVLCLTNYFFFVCWQRSSTRRLMYFIYILLCQNLKSRINEISLFTKKSCHLCNLALHRHTLYCNSSHFLCLSWTTFASLINKAFVKVSKGETALRINYLIIVIWSVLFCFIDQTQTEISQPYTFEVTVLSFDLWKSHEKMLV